MKVISLYSVLMICMIVLVFPSAVRAEETSGNGVQKGVQTISKKTEQGVQKVESAAEKAAENIEAKKKGS